MANKALQQGEQLLQTDRTLYMDLGNNRYARVLGSIVALGNQVVSDANPFPVLLKTGGGQDISTDDITDALTTIDIFHHEAHEGELFSVSYKTADGAPLADNATIVLAIQSATKYLHFQAFGALGGDAEMEFYSGSTIAADGTLMTPSNHNISKGLSDATVRRDPTVTVAGTLRDNFLIPGGTGGNAIGGDGDQRDEWIIPPLTWAFARLTNRAGNAQPASLKAVWYEESTN